MRAVEERHANRLRALAESSHEFAEATADLGRLLNIVARRFAQLIGDGCFVRLLAGDGVTLVPVATHHPDADTERYLRETADREPMLLGEGISGRVVATGEPAFMPVLPLEQFIKLAPPAFVPIFTKVGLTSLIVVRLRARTQNLGYIGLVRTGSGRPAYTEDDLHLVQDLADRAALAIDTGRLLEGLERKVAERTSALELQNKELEAFASSLSLDLRSPLRAIDGFARALDEDHAAALDGDAQRAIAAIRRNARQMTQLVEHLLKLSRTGHQAIEPLVEVGMVPLVEAVVAGVRTQHRASAEIQIGELPPATGNTELLRQVWINLVDNALKFSRERTPPVIAIAGERAAGEVRYTVTDNGVGFEPAQADKLFTVFQRLHRASEFAGSGVGLALVQRIVMRHGGRVWAAGRPGAGATFGFALPR